MRHWMLRGRRRCRRMLSCRGNRAGSLNSGCAAGKRHQRNVTRALDRHAEPPLMARAHSRHAARQDFAPLLHELRQNVCAFVVDEVHLLDTEFANLLLAKILPFTAARAAGACTFAARTTVPAARPSMTTRAAFATPTTWSASPTWSDGRLRLFLFLCHSCLPFNKPKLDQICLTSLSETPAASTLN